MAITRYIAEAGLTADTTAVALQRLRNRRIVNRYDGSTVTDNASSITGVGTDDNIVLSSAVTIPTGYNVFVDRTVIIQDTFNTNTNGSHLSFFNCNIIVETAGGNPGPFAVTTGQLNNTAVPSGVATGQAAGRSLNFYGCSLLINPTFSNFFQMFSDFMDSNMTFTQPTGAGGVGVNIPLPSFVVGSRVINGTFYATAKNANAVFEIYGIPDVVEGLDVFRMSLEYTGQAGEGSLMFVEPNFSSPELQRRWRSQTPGADTLIQSIGFYTPPDNTSANNITTDNSAPAYFRATNNAGGQLLNYYAWRPSFFSDVTLTTPIPGVRVRGGSNIVINGAGQALNAPESNISAAFTNTSGIDLTGSAISVVNEFVTDANGVPVADANSSVSFNGGTSFTDGQWFDWLRLGSANVASATTAGNSLGTNFSGQDSPDNVIFAPISRHDFNNFNQYSATYEARSYTHEVSSGVISQNGRIGTDPGQQTGNVPVAIEDATTVAAAVSYVNNTEAQALAGFDATGNKTASAAAQFIRASWSTYETNVEPTGTSSSITWLGAITINSTNSNSVAVGAQVVLNRVNELVAGDIDTLSASSFVIGTDITGVDLTATGNIDLGTGNTITGTTLTAASYSNFPTTLDGSITFVGTNTFSGTSSLTVTDRSNLGGLTLNVPLGVVLNVTGAGASDFAAVTGAGTVNYLLAYPIVNERTSGLLTVYRDGVVEVVTNEIPNIQANQVIDVIYSEIGRTDFLQRINTGASPGPVTVTIMNSPTPFPTASPAIGVFTPQVPSAGFMNIMVSESIISEGEVNNALQTQVKATANYNALIQMTQQTDIISSDGAASTAAADSDHIQFIAVRPISVGYIRSTGADQSSEALAGPTTTGTFTPAGGGGSPSTITVGVVINAPQAFDAAITGGQIGDAVEAINNNTDAELAQVTGDVREMRDNRYLGIRRQPVRT